MNPSGPVLLRAQQPLGAPPWPSSSCVSFRRGAPCPLSGSAAPSPRGAARAADGRPAAPKRSCIPCHFHQRITVQREKLTRSMVYQNCQTVTQDFHCYVAIVITNVFEINVPDYLLPYPYPYRPTLILITLPLSRKYRRTTAAVPLASHLELANLYTSKGLPICPPLPLCRTNPPLPRMRAGLPALATTAPGTTTPTLPPLLCNVFAPAPAAPTVSGPSSSFWKCRRLTQPRICGTPGGHMKRAARICSDGAQKLADDFASRTYSDTPTDDQSHTRAGFSENTRNLW